MPKPFDELDREIREALRRRAEADRARVAAARASGRKEPFDADRFLAAYNVTLDLGSLSLTREHLDDYEPQYYLTAPAEVRTLGAYVEYLWWLRQNDAT